MPEYDPRKFSTPSTFPPELRGPTGLEFRTPSGMTASELVTTLQLGNEWHNVPLLVPEQIHLKHLLRGKNPTLEQLSRAVSWYRAQPAPTQQAFPSLAEALRAEEARHRQLESAAKAQGK